MNPLDFKLYDVSDFPIVRLRSASRPPDAAQTWTHEMDALIAHNTPFVLLFPEHHHEEEESHEEQRTIAKWMKANKAAYAKLCRAIVSIEPNAAKRLARQAQSAVFGKAFGLRFVIVADQQEAEVRARTELSGTVPA